MKAMKHKVFTGEEPVICRTTHYLLDALKNAKTNEEKEDIIKIILSGEYESFSLEENINMLHEVIDLTEDIDTKFKLLSMIDNSIIRNNRLNSVPNMMYNPYYSMPFCSYGGPSSDPKFAPPFQNPYTKRPLCSIDVTTEEKAKTKCTHWKDYCIDIKINSDEEYYECAICHKKIKSIDLLSEDDMINSADNICSSIEWIKMLNCIGHVLSEEEVNKLTDMIPYINKLSHILEVLKTEVENATQIK